MFILSLALALAPVIAIILYVYMRDEYDKEPLQILLMAFIMGVFSTIPALIIGYYGEQLGFGHSVNIFKTFIHAFIVVALAEEIGKFFFLKVFLFPNKAFDEPYDGIIYGVMIGMGFAAFENIIYVMQGGVEIAILRMFTAVPAHAAFGAIMGYFVGLAKFDYANRNRLALMGLFWAVVIHGSYDFFIMQNRFEMLGLLTFVVLIVSLVMSQKAIKIHNLNSPFHPENQLSTKSDVLATNETNITKKEASKTETKKAIPPLTIPPEKNPTQKENIDDYLDDVL